MMFVQIGKHTRQPGLLFVAGARVTIRMIRQRQPAIGAAQFTGRELGRQVCAELDERVEPLSLAPGQGPGRSNGLRHGPEGLRLRLWRRRWPLMIRRPVPGNGSIRRRPERPRRRGEQQRVWRNVTGLERRVRDALKLFESAHLFIEDVGEGRGAAHEVAIGLRARRLSRFRRADGSLRGARGEPRGYDYPARYCQQIALGPPGCSRSRRADCGDQRVHDRRCRSHQV